MHVLVVGSYAPSLLNFRGPLLRDMVRGGHSVSVAAPAITAELRRDLEALGASVFETPLERNGTGAFADLRYLLTLRRLVREAKPDVVLTYTIKPNIWGSFAARFNGAQSVAMVTGLGYAFTDTGIPASAKQRLIQKVAAQLYALATHFNRRVIFQNPDDLNEFIANGCLRDGSKARLVNGSGVDLAHFTPAPLPDQPIFLMIARLLGNKGLREYALAAAQAKKKIPNGRFLLAGPEDAGVDGMAAEQLADLSGGAIEYLGPLDDVRPALAAARVLVLPSFREGTPRSVLEAMAMGRAIITTDAPGCRETIQDGISGLLIPPRDAQALATAMIRLANEPELTARMADNALKSAREKYDVRHVNRAVMEILGLSLDIR